MSFRLCALVGMDGRHSVILREVIRLFAKKGLIQTWQFADSLDPTAHILICDTDNSAGLYAWRWCAASNTPRVAVTAAPAGVEGTVIAKPLRVEELQKLVAALNAVGGAPEPAAKPTLAEQAPAPVLQAPLPPSEPPAEPAAPRESKPALRLAWSQPDAPPAPRDPAPPTGPAMPDAAPHVATRVVPDGNTSRVVFAPEAAPASQEPFAVTARLQDEPAPQQVPAVAEAAVEPPPASPQPVATPVADLPPVSPAEPLAVAPVDAPAGPPGQAGPEPLVEATSAPPAAADLAPREATPEPVVAAAPLPAPEPAIPATTAPAAPALAPLPAVASLAPEAPAIPMPAPPPAPDLLGTATAEAPAARPEALPSAPPRPAPLFTEPSATPPAPDAGFETFVPSERAGEFREQKPVAAPDEDRIRLIFQHLRDAPQPSRAEEQEDVATILRRLRSIRRPAVLHLDGIAPICVAVTEGSFYARADLSEIAAALARQPEPLRTAVVDSVASGCREADCADALPRPLAHLAWVAALHGRAPDVALFEERAYKLRQWPDLVQLPHEPRHMRWCGLLTRRPATVAALQEATGASGEEVAAFLTACGELGILERTKVSAEAAAKVEAPSSEKARERVTIFRSLLNRLGLRR